LGAQNGKATAELLDALRGSVAAIENLATGDAFEILNGPALASLSADVQDIIQWTISAGQPFIISGPRKAQKTTIALDAAISIVSGKPFLGCREVLQAGPVLFLSGESGLPTLRETALRICRAKEINLGDLDGLHVSTQLPVFENAESLQRLRRTIKVTGAGALFVDPVYLCMSGADAANLFSMGAQLRPISELCQQVGATLVLCHHNKRTTGRERFSPPELDDIAWSGFAEFARGWLLIDRREAYQPGTGVHKLWLSIGGSAGHSSLLAVDICEGLRSDPEGRRWDVVVQTAEQAIVEARRQKDDRRAARRADQQGDDRRRLLEALRRCPKGDTLRKLRELAGLSGERAGDAIRCLIGEGRAEQAKVMKNGREEDGYRSTGK
jgi:hypothetical protein